ncbi:hypothetical protein [Hymenobacter arizonensis]|uniref:Surface antigen n=1 Tax=Hymenobacter arizonensis TaxID=1227077 RepID=A0A1I6BK26_HYMAR|nr:hypothetical protein [Hymenobacter arizonensis]SFQ81285.1 hypothetical protein SAMN04515668_4642 [Hymenobacter arizonensis]
MLGGTGAAAPGLVSVALPALLTQARAAGPGSVLVVLGDQWPVAGMPSKHEHAKQAAETRLRPLLAELQTFPGRVVFLPGEAEWQDGGARGWDRVRQQEAFIKAALPRALFLPSDGCPGPVELALDATHTLVVLDTQWWLHAWEKPGEASSCDAKDPGAVAAQLDDILSRSQGKHVLVAGHHPLFSAGYGAALALLPNPRNRLLRQSLLSVLNRYPHLTYVGGHEPSLQYLEPGAGQHYVVSGAGATAGGRKPRPTAVFAARTTGFARLDYGTADSVTLRLCSAAGPVLFQRGWREPTSVAPSPAPALVSARLDTTAQVRAGAQYGAGKWRTRLLGANYRAEWGQAVRVPVLDLARAHGGLTPLKRGGGQQTKSLRLLGGDGREYVLRSISKDVDRAVPAFLRHTLAADVVQDQISASHPYAALTVPTLAEAAGVPHTRPQVVLVPDDPRLGPYRHSFAGALALLEARDPGPPAAFTGQLLPKTYSTADVIEQLQADPRHRVDQRQVLRARLLDMVLADWDRHEDQWRWLAYRRPDGGRLFRAAPRDRDQAYFVNQGLVPRRASSEWMLPKFQGFDYTFRNVNSFNFQARYFDRRFLTELSEADWRAVADSVRAALTEDVLARALAQLPDSVYQHSGATLLAKLRAHRDQLPAWAGQYYRFLARNVDVVGSDGREAFEVERRGSDQTRVSVFALSAQGQRGPVKYERVFNAAETREIRLYGLGGDDVFTVRGTAGEGPLLRIIGGAGRDSVSDDSRVRHGPRRTQVYDEPRGLALTTGPETRDRRAATAGVNDYDPQAFQYNYTGPRYPVAFNVDDGVFLGLGVLWRRPGFRNPPWAVTQQLTGSVALATGAFSFAYAGQFNHLLGPYDVQVQAGLQAPNYVRNFFGLGNETRFDESQGIRYYRVRFRELALSVQLQRRLSTRWQLAAGPSYQAVEVERTAGRLLAGLSDERLRPAALFTPKHYAGGTMRVSYDGRPPALLLPDGLRWHAELLTLRSLNTAARPLTRLSSELALYRSVRYPVQLTLAARLGGTAVLSHDYEFFQAAVLDGLTTLRGYRRTRFAGRQSVYNNAEVRLRVGQFRTYLFPASYGMLAFHDLGRVWMPGEGASRWHRGYGGGVWVAPFQQVVLSAMYGFSGEDSLPLVRLGFFF